MWPLKNFSVSDLRKGVYVSCGFHFLVSLFFLIATSLDPSLTFLGIIELWVVLNTTFAMITNTHFVLWSMITNQIVIAVCSGGLIIAAFVTAKFELFIIFCPILVLEIYFIKITLRCYYEMKCRVGYVISPEVAEESNSTPQVIVQTQPQASNVQSNPIIRLPDRDISHSYHAPQTTITYLQPGSTDCTPDQHSYPPYHIQPPFNPAYVNSSHPITQSY